MNEDGLKKKKMLAVILAVVITLLIVVVYIFLLRLKPTEQNIKYKIGDMKEVREIKETFSKLFSN